MGQRSVFERIGLVCVAVVSTAVVSDVLTYAATGSSLIMGRINTAGGVTTIQNTGAGSALRLITKAATTPPLAVNGKGKVVNLYADRAATADNALKVGGKTVAQIQVAAKGAKGDPGANGDPGAVGPQGPIGVTSAQFGRQIPAITSLDTAGVTRADSSITVGADGLPLIAFLDTTNHAVKVDRCTNVACAYAIEVTIDSDLTSTGATPSITVGDDGLAIISYARGGQLRVAHCTTLDCSTPSVSAGLSSPGYAVDTTSIAIGTDGFPVVAYQRFTQGGLFRGDQLLVLHCTTADCTNTSATATIDSSGYAGSYVSITIGSDGLPIMSYENSYSTDLTVAHCDTVDCASATISTIDSTGPVGFDTSITIGTDGLPVISYGGNASLKFAHCDTVVCATATTSTIDSNGDVGRFTSITIGTDGLPVISYYDTSNSDLKLARCDTASCATAHTAAIDTAGAVGLFTSITLGADGLPIISYYDAGNQAMKVAHLMHTSWTVHGWGR